MNINKWVKSGLVYAPSGAHDFDISHCHKPTPLQVDDDTIRVYFGVRCSKVKTRTTFIDVDADNPNKIKYIHDKPVLDLGKIGAFDDSGANVSSIVRRGDTIYMYYIGWNPSTTVHTRNSIGLAVSRDNGFTFERLFDGPVLDRNKFEPYYTGAVDVLKETDLWRMWYTSGTEWKYINGKPEIFYHIKYAHSGNGEDWIRDNVSSILPENEHEAIARPSVQRIGDEYHMWFSRRSIVDFRTNPDKGYRAGYAISCDGINWERQGNVGIQPSDEGWDSKTIAYPYVIQRNGKLIMFYNGNGFGKTGFGCAHADIPA
jgi:predicted GH43/DUF377 family glycosyl hydrolase